MTDFITKDSGVREEYKTGMVRDTQEGKARFSLLRPVGVPYDSQFLTRCAELMTRGAEKYGLRNWEKAHTPEELERFLDSAERHMQQWLAGETDEDHAAAVFFNMMAAETVRWKMKQEDDFEAQDTWDLPALEEAAQLDWGWLHSPGTGVAMTEVPGGTITVNLPVEIPYHHHDLEHGSVRYYAGPEGDWHREIPAHKHKGDAVLPHELGDIDPFNHTR